MKRIVYFFLLFFTIFTAQAQHINRYCNSAFPFCVDVPGNFNRTTKSTMGDGQNFTAKDGSTLVIYGAYNLEKETVENRFQREQTALTSDTTVAHSTQIPTIHKAETEGNTFSIYYQSQGFNYLIHRKLENNNWLSLEMKYPAAKAKDYEEKAARMIKSFK